MNEHTRRLAVFPGMFDPITYGHLDIIRRGLLIFDELVIGVGDNPEKALMLPQATRVEIVREVTAALSNVRVETYSGLTVDFVRRLDATAIIRGIRSAGDLEYEFQMAVTNRAVAGVETIFIMPSPEHAFMRSSLIRQVARMGGDISAMVPPQVLAHISGPP